MYILKETAVHRKETNCQHVLEKLHAQIEYYDTHVVMLHNKVNILLRDTYIMKLPPPKDSVVTGFWLGSHSVVNVSLCLRLLMSWWIPSSPTELSPRLSSSIDVLCCNMCDIEEAPSTPMGLESKSRSFRDEFFQNAAASLLAPCPLMWQSCNTNHVSVHFDWSLSIDAKLFTLPCQTESLKCPVLSENCCDWV